jgi:hypothetical protein
MRARARNGQERPGFATIRRLRRHCAVAPWSTVRSISTCIYGVPTEIRKSSVTFTDLGDDTRKIANLLEDRPPTGQAQFVTSRRKSARFGPVGGNRGATLRWSRRGKVYLRSSSSYPLKTRSSSSRL